MRKHLPFFVILLAGIALIILAQFSIPTIVGADGYLHIRMSVFLRDFGPHYQFHWARYSFFFTYFCDKDFLYHVLLIPFTFFKNIFFGAKVAAAVSAVALYLIFFALLRRYCRLRSVVCLALVCFFLSAPFLRALCEPRNMVMIIGLTLLFTHYLIRGNCWALGIIAAVYALSHVSGPYLILFALLGEGARWASERRFVWKTIAATAVGLAVGFLVHPNFPNNLLYFYLNGIAVPLYSLKWGLELGAEFFPVDSRELVLGYPLILLGVLFIAALATAQGNKVKTSTKMWMSITGFFFVFSFFSRRYLIHCYPMFLISAAALCADWWESAPRLEAARKYLAVKVASIIMVFALLAGLGMHTYKEFSDIRLAETVFNGHYEAVGKWLAQNVPENEIIFHSNWSDSQYFIGLNPKDDYFVTLDPIYMYYWNPKKYQLYREIAFGNNADPYTNLKKEFHVRYGYVGKNYFSGLLNQIRKDSRFQVLAENEYGAIFKLVD